jgi:hypothetical protein
MYSLFESRESHEWARRTQSLSVAVRYATNMTLVSLYPTAPSRYGHTCVRFHDGASQVAEGVAGVRQRGPRYNRIHC